MRKIHWCWCSQRFRHTSRWSDTHRYLMRNETEIRQWVKPCKRNKIWFLCYAPLGLNWSCIDPFETRCRPDLHTKQFLSYFTSTEIDFNIPFDIRQYRSTFYGSWATVLRKFVGLVTRNNWHSRIIVKFPHSTMLHRLNRPL